MSKNTGTIFETRIVKYFQEEITNNKLFAKPECCQVFHRKGYFSADRNEEIIFDVSIEVTSPGQTKPTILILIECKDYSSPVPVDDAEEFYAKFQQIKGICVKGYMASTNSFQKGTISFSKSKGIGLIRYFPNQKPQYILTRLTSRFPQKYNEYNHAKRCYAALTIEDYHFPSSHLFVYANGVFVDGFISLMQRCLSSSSLDIIKDSETDSGNPSIYLSDPVEYISLERIEKLAQDVLNQCHYTSCEVNLFHIINLLNRSSSIDIEFSNNILIDPFGDPMLGNLDYSNNRISIYERAHKSMAHQRFTLAHEIGHIILNHSKYVTNEFHMKQDLDIQDKEYIGEGLFRMEWQANKLASCLLLPRVQFTKAVECILNKHEVFDRGHGQIFVDQQICNKANYYKITDDLKSLFGVSRSAIRYRLISLGILKDIRSH